MLMPNFGGTNKEYYGILDSGLLCIQLYSHGGFFEKGSGRQKRGIASI